MCSSDDKSDWVWHSNLYELYYFSNVFELSWTLKYIVRTIHNYARTHTDRKDFPLAGRRLMLDGDHITDALVSLHRLRVPERIQYKVAVLGYRVLRGSAPRYRGPLTRVADVPGRRQPPPIVSSCRRSNSPLSAAELFRLPLPPSGTRSPITSSTHLLYSHFNIIWKHSCSDVHFRTFFCS